jgi:hypothetical protein
MIPITPPKAHYVQINLSDILTALGEDETKLILSNFSCPKNKDVENFLKNKAIEFSKRSFSKTHLVYWVTDDGAQRELVGYYTIASKWISVERSVVTSREARKLREHGIFDEKTNKYIVSAPLIGQLGKNFAEGNDTLISGAELLSLAIEKVREVQNEVGGRFVYLECEDNEALKKFYRDNKFKEFGKRKLDGDETDLKGEYLIQLFAML